MSRKVALIIGITGQDGSCLAEFLLKKGFKVHGIKRRSSLFNTDRIDHLYQDPDLEDRNFILHFGDLTASMNLTRIIQIVANDALALGMEVIGYDPFLSIESAWKLSSNIQKATGLETLLGDIDYLTIHAPLMESTKEMIDSEKFAMMKDGVKIMNFARGGLVNNDALKSAIASGKVSAYVTDFPDGDLLDIKQVIPIPHLGASTGESEDNCAVMACTQVKHFLETGNIKNSVNFPNCEQPRIAGAKRVIIANKNMLSMISEITSLLAKHNINIANMLNKSEGDLAYSIIDIEDGDLHEPMIDKLRAIRGVIMARIIE